MKCAAARSSADPDSLTRTANRSSRLQPRSKETSARRASARFAGDSDMKGREEGGPNVPSTIMGGAIGSRSGLASLGSDTLRGFHSHPSLPSRLIPRRGVDAPAKPARKTGGGPLGLERAPNLFSPNAMTASGILHGVPRVASESPSWCRALRHRDSVASAQSSAHCPRQPQRCEPHLRPARWARSQPP